MARQLVAQRRPGAEVTLRQSRGGVFEVVVDGALRYSKRATGRFPTDEELLAAVS